MAWWQEINETRILVAPAQNSTESQSGNLLSVRHPKSGNKLCCLYIDGSLQELNRFKEPYGSWFLGDYVAEDGSLYIVTPVDPVFILLPIFEEARMKKGDAPGKFRQLDEIIFVNDFPAYQHLSSIAEKSMEVVCDIKEIGSTKFFRINDSKVLAWLSCKVNQLKQTLTMLDKNYSAQSEKDTLIDVLSILGEYLRDEPWLNLLCEKLEISLKQIDKAERGDCLPSLTENEFQSFNPLEEKKGSEKKASRNGKQTKKQKLETDSRDIKEMFTRASRKPR